MSNLIDSAPTICIASVGSIGTNFHPSNKAADAWFGAAIAARVST
ncbi:hypothetical protein CPter91_1927 [Collimonas pratensis]|uniref:Uncharacterized protein n=1 Tax=Collimonas pratensis TaxID=279113 RepID=A0A127Q2M3_9BURK|nr:hypothetical protein CPter91_1927 [Collimonas pratensis]